MDPNLPQNQPAGLAGLPPAANPLQGNGQSPIPAAPMAPSAPGAVPVASPGAGQPISEQAKQLLQQYGRDPFKLSSAFGELKQQHLAEQYQIVPNSIER
jgi:hypothetical protein